MFYTVFCQRVSIIFYHLNQTNHSSFCVHYCIYLSMSVTFNSHFRVLLNGRTETYTSGSQHLLSGFVDLRTCRKQFQWLTVSYLKVFCTNNHLIKHVVLLQSSANQVYEYKTISSIVSVYLLMTDLHIIQLSIIKI